MASATSVATPDVAIGIHQRVTGGPDGDVGYTVRAHQGTVTVEPGDRSADVEIVQDYETAAAISQGRLSPAAAFASGRLKVVGSISLLVEHQEALTGDRGLLAELAATTTY